MEKSMVKEYLKKRADKNLRPQTHEEAYEIEVNKFVAEVTLALEDPEAQICTTNVHQRQIGALDKFIDEIIEDVFHKHLPVNDKKKKEFLDLIKKTDNLFLVHALEIRLKCQPKIALLEKSALPAFEEAMQKKADLNALTLYDVLRKKIHDWAFDADIEHSEILKRLQQIGFDLKNEINAKKKKY
ncbi:MAG: hypothetical protein WC719_04745 [Patescibacteria group bacterium]|jgi:hypothetical protein